MTLQAVVNVLALIIVVGISSGLICGITATIITSIRGTKIKSNVEAVSEALEKGYCLEMQGLVIDVQKARKVVRLTAPPSGSEAWRG